MSTSKHAAAKRARDKAIARLTETYAACECEWPLVMYRNGHGHGKTQVGAPCPAIAVLERIRAEDES